MLAGPPFAILDIDLYVDSELATTYSCDGLIISTPVGSTAHSLSAGGPILRKDLQAFVISPISPHTLTKRPVVDSAERVYEMEVREPHAGTTVVADGRTLATLSRAIACGSSGRMPVSNWWLSRATPTTHAARKARLGRPAGGKERSSRLADLDARSC